MNYEGPAGGARSSDGTFDYGLVASYKEALLKSQSNSITPTSTKWNNPLRHSPALVVLLETTTDGPVEFTETEFDSVGKLKRHLDNVESRSQKRRIYLMEGLSLDFVGVLGCHLSIPPIFFRRHEQTCVRSRNHLYANELLHEAPQVDLQGSICFRYAEIRQFNRILKYISYFCSRTGRHIDTIASRVREETTTAFVTRKASWWGRNRGDGWDVVILCDPQLSDIAPNKDITDYHALRNTAYQGGYNSFIPIRRNKDTTKMPRHPQHSMLKDLHYYLTNHAERFSEIEWNDVTTSLIFLTKIVAAHWAQVAESMKVILPSLEPSLLFGLDSRQNQAQIVAVADMRKRSYMYMDYIRDSLLNLRSMSRKWYNTANSDKANADSWKTCQKDLEFILYRLGVCSERAAGMLASGRAMLSIRKHEQVHFSAKTRRRYIFLFYLFFPLYFTSSLFGMPGAFAPGNGKFWIYFVSAIGVVTVTFLISRAADYLLDEERGVLWRRFSREGKRFEQS